MHPFAIPRWLCADREVALEAYMAESTHADRNSVINVCVCPMNIFRRV